MYCLYFAISTINQLGGAASCNLHVNPNFVSNWSLKSLIGIIGSIGQINPEITEIISYLKWIEQLFLCNEVEEKKENVLIWNMSL